MRLELFEPDEWSFIAGAVDLLTTNPFHPGWAEKEFTLLGRPPREAPEVIAWEPGATLWGPQSAYGEEIYQRIIRIGDCLLHRLRSGRSASAEELGQYELVGLYCLYCRHGEAMDRLIHAAVQKRARERDAEQPDKEDRGKTLWEGFQADHDRLFGFADRAFPRHHKPEHLFACFFLFRRAFYHIFFNIVGGSRPISRLRSAVWESIVTHDLLGWMQGLHRQMKDISTLITGPSGTGKERVAEAIGRSLFIPFDAKKGFAIDFMDAFNPVSLAALSSHLMESELFGHVKGAFSGAVKERMGRLEKCPEQGAVFLDEIGELTAEIQVKLLRVLAARCFQRVGDNEDRPFRGKVIAATNRDLVAEMEAGRFREDFYYRLRGDQITTPSLYEQLEDRPEDLAIMVEHVCRSVVGSERAADYAREVVGWVEQHLRGYAWPGNFRELEQCVRSYTVRKEYHPARRAPVREEEGAPQPATDPDLLADGCAALAAAVLKIRAAAGSDRQVRERRLFEQIKGHLFALVRARTRTKQEAANLLGIDVRTLDAAMAEPAGDP